MYAKIEGLLDFLVVSEPVSKLLPPWGSVPLAHVAAVDFTAHTIAVEEVDRLLASCVFATAVGSSWRQRSAYFYTEFPSGLNNVRLQVYALWGSTLEDGCLVFDAENSPQAVPIGDAFKQQFGDLVLSFREACAEPEYFGSPVSARDTGFGSYIAAALESRLCSLPFNGSTGGVSVKCVEATHKWCEGIYPEFPSQFPVWIVQW